MKVTFLSLLVYLTAIFAIEGKRDVEARAGVVKTRLHQHIFRRHVKHKHHRFTHHPHNGHHHNHHLHHLHHHAHYHAPFKHHFHRHPHKHYLHHHPHKHHFHHPLKRPFHHHHHHHHPHKHYFHRYPLKHHFHRHSRHHHFHHGHPKRHFNHQHHPHTHHIHTHHDQHKHSKHVPDLHRKLKLHVTMKDAQPLKRHSLPELLTKLGQHLMKLGGSLGPSTPLTEAAVKYGNRTFQNGIPANASLSSSGPVSPSSFATPSSSNTKISEVAAKILAQTPSNGASGFKLGSVSSGAESANGVETKGRILEGTSSTANASYSIDSQTSTSTSATSVDGNINQTISNEPGSPSSTQGNQTVSIVDTDKIRTAEGPKATGNEESQSTFNKTETTLSSEHIGDNLTEKPKGMLAKSIDKESPIQAKQSGGTEKKGSGETAEVKEKESHDEPEHKTQASSNETPAQKRLVKSEEPQGVGKEAASLQAHNTSIFDNPEEPFLNKSLGQYSSVAQEKPQGAVMEGESSIQIKNHSLDEHLTVTESNPVQRTMDKDESHQVKEIEKEGSSQPTNDEPKESLLSDNPDQDLIAEHKMSQDTDVPKDASIQSDKNSSEDADKPASERRQEQMMLAKDQGTRSEKGASFRTKKPTVDKSIQDENPDEDLVVEHEEDQSEWMKKASIESKQRTSDESDKTVPGSTELDHTATAKDEEHHDQDKGIEKKASFPAKEPTFDEPEKPIPKNNPDQDRVDKYEESQEAEDEKETSGESDEHSSSESDKEADPESSQDQRKTVTDESHQVAGTEKEASVQTSEPTIDDPVELSENPDKDLAVEKEESKDAGTEKETASNDSSDESGKPVPEENLDEGTTAKEEGHQGRRVEEETSLQTDKPTIDEQPALSENPDKDLIKSQEEQYQSDEKAEKKASIQSIKPSPDQPEKLVLASNLDQTKIAKDEGHQVIGIDKKVSFKTSQPSIDEIEKPVSGEILSKQTIPYDLGSQQTIPYDLGSQQTIPYDLSSQTYSTGTEPSFQTNDPVLDQPVQLVLVNKADQNATARDVTTEVDPDVQASQGVVDEPEKAIPTQKFGKVLQAESDGSKLVLAEKFDQSAAARDVTTEVDPDVQASQAVVDEPEKAIPAQNRGKVLQAESDGPQLLAIQKALLNQTDQPTFDEPDQPSARSASQIAMAESEIPAPTAPTIFDQSVGLSGKGIDERPEEATLGNDLQETSDAPDDAPGSPLSRPTDDDSPTEESITSLSPVPTSSVTTASSPFGPTVSSYLESPTSAERYSAFSSPEIAVSEIPTPPAPRADYQRDMLDDPVEESLDANVESLKH